MTKHFCDLCGVELNTNNSIESVHDRGVVKRNMIGDIEMCNSKFTLTLTRGSTPQDCCMNCACDFFESADERKPPDTWVPPNIDPSPSGD